MRSSCVTRLHVRRPVPLKKKPKPTAFEQEQEAHSNCATAPSWSVTRVAGPLSLCTFLFLRWPTPACSSLTLSMSTSATPNHLRGGGVALGTPPTTSLSGELPGDGRRSPPAKGGPDDDTGSARRQEAKEATQNGQLAARSWRQAFIQKRRKGSAPLSASQSVHGRHPEQGVECCS